MDYIKEFPQAFMWVWLTETPARILERGKKERLAYLFPWLLLVMSLLYADFIQKILSCEFPGLHVTSPRAHH